MTVAHSFKSASDLAAYHADPRQGHRYGRDSSPEVRAAERSIEAYHPDYEAVLFGSGMAAISAVFGALGGDCIALPRECYRKVIPLAGDRAMFWDAQGAGSKASLIWAESPSNPHLRLCDYERLQGLAAEVPVALDLTFSGLGNFNSEFPQVIVHSLTKYVCGHNDFMAGVVLARGKFAEKVWRHRSMAGGIPDPNTARLLSRSLKTYDLRIERQVGNALMVLDWLRDLGVEHVFYPPQSKWHDHGGSVISFRVAGADPAELTDRIGQLPTIKMAPSFGAVDSMAEVPATMSRAPGVEPDLVRLSVGIEPVNTIIADLETVLA